jgi:hypothetical protein
MSEAVRLIRSKMLELRSVTLTKAEAGEIAAVVEAAHTEAIREVDQPKKSSGDIYLDLAAAVEPFVVAARKEGRPTSVTCAVCDGLIDFSQSGQGIVVGWCGTCMGAERRDALAEASTQIKARIRSGAGPEGLGVQEAINQGIRDALVVLDRLGGVETTNETKEQR